MTGLDTLLDTWNAIVTKLMWALGQTKKYEQIRWLFGTNLVGEVTLNRQNKA